MIGKLLHFLKQPGEATDPERVVMLAAATLLLEVAWADQNISEEEIGLISRQLRRQFGLSEDDIAAVIAESRAKQEESVGVYSYTRTINEAWEEPQKFELVVALWRLALSDDQLHRYEEHSIRRIAELLYLSHTRFIEAKLKAKRDAES